MKSSIGLYYQITVTDKNGKTVKKTRMHKSKSFVIAFLKFMESHLNKSSISITDIDNTPQVSDPTYVECLVAKAASGTITLGIVVGTGTTTPTNTDYKLETQIAHGSAATQINYAAMSFIAAQEVGANVDLQAVRSFQNLSGTTINVTEAGIQAKIKVSKYGLIIHDTFTAVPVPNGQTMTVTYTLRTTV